MSIFGDHRRLDMQITMRIKKKEDEPRSADESTVMAMIVMESFFGFVIGTKTDAMRLNEMK